MSTLHLIARAPVGTDVLSRCVASAVAGDGILFLGQGVWAARHIDPIEGVELYAHTEDVHRSQLAHQLPTCVQLIDDLRFVELVERFTVSVSWA